MLTSLSFLEPGQPWPPESETARLKKYMDNELLFNSKHDKVYKNWTRLIRADRMATLEIILNWPKRLSLLWADLLLGEPPNINAGESGSAEANTFAEIKKRNPKLTKKFYEGAIDISRFGDGLLKIRHDGKKSIIESQSPKFWFPVVQADNIKEVTAHVLAFTYEQYDALIIGQGTRKQTYLKAEIHERGKITTRIFKIKEPNSNATISSEVGVPQVRETGVDDFLIVQISNVTTTSSIYGYDDYTDLDTIIQERDIRFAQISRILDKHSDPNMYGPDTGVTKDPITGESKMIAGGKFWPLAEGETPPGYVVWNGQLDSAFLELERLLEELYVISETSPAAFGQLKAGLAESGSALRRLMMAPLAKVNRIRLNYDTEIKKAIELASKLEIIQRTLPGAVPLEDIHIEWQDGLPEDPKETHDIQNADYLAGTVSLETILRQRGLDGKQLDEELARIKKAEAAKNPPISPPQVRPIVTEPVTDPTKPKLEDKPATPPITTGNQAKGAQSQITTQQTSTTEPEKGTA